MVEPVTVFLVAVACLLVAAAAARPLAARTGVPEALWLVAVGALLRATGLASAATIAALAPFFAALALIIVLFEAGRDMRFGEGDGVGGRARRLAGAGAVLSVPAVMLLSMALSGLNLLPTWSWTHGLMLGALLLATAPEVFSPSLKQAGAPAKVVATLERESAIRGALAIAVTATCIDLLSLRVGEGQALAAIAAGFGLGLAFGAFAGLLWIAAIRRVGPVRSVYPYTLAGLLGLYVVTDVLGGIGALAVLVFGAVVANAGALVAVLFRPRGAQSEGDAADEDFRAALDDHARTVEIVRALLFLFIGLGLGPPWGLLLMGIALGLILVVTRLLATRLVLRGLPEQEHAALAAGWPSGMVVAGLAALPHAAAVPGTEHLTTLVFSAVVTTCVAFAFGRAHGHSAARAELAPATGPKEPARMDMALGTAAGPKRTAGGTEIRPPEEVKRTAGGTEIRPPEEVKRTAGGTEIRPPEEVKRTAGGTEIRPPEELRRTTERTEIRAPTVEEVFAPVAGARESSGSRAVVRVVPAGPPLAQAMGSGALGESTEAPARVAEDAQALGSGALDGSGETAVRGPSAEVAAPHPEVVPQLGSGSMASTPAGPEGEPRARTDAQSMGSGAVAGATPVERAPLDVRAMFAASTDRLAGTERQVPKTMSEWAGSFDQHGDERDG